LPDLGVRMEDRGSGAQAKTVWKLEDRAQLLRERQQRREGQEAREALKREGQEAKEALQREAARSERV